MNPDDLLQRRIERRARRLLELQNVLDDCRAMLETLDTDCPEAEKLRQRIARAEHELARQQGLAKGRPLPDVDQSDLHHELAHWTGNLDDEGP